MEITKIASLSTEEKDTLIKVGELAKTIRSQLETKQIDLINNQDLDLIKAVEQALSKITKESNN